ncbi:MAG: tetratricopeptide repeat protein [Pirellulales bacterium]
MSVDPQNDQDLSRKLAVTVDAPPVAATADYGGEAAAGFVVGGRYTLREKIGEGGMGEVWVAKQIEPVKRKVALKLIKTGMASRTVVQRFEQERQALALMDHPNIARVLDGGLTSTGQPFFVMELVNGLPLTKFCDELKLTTRARLELFLTICHAVQHAHQKGIVHRDLKPANILVAMIDGKPVPKVIDFGVAKATSGKLTEETMSTGFGAVVGTLEYMSPEQAGYSGEDIDTRADIYSLGVVLYELLTGLRPIDAKRLKKAAYTEMIRLIQEEEPSKPSTRLATDDSLPALAALRQTEPKSLMALLRGELDWVVMKCLEKQRDRRYETANSLARDIQRYLKDEVVEARPPSAIYRLRKFVRRNPAPLALAGSLLLLLLGGASLAWWQSEEAGKRRELELQRRLEKEQRAAIDNARQARDAEAAASLLTQAEEALRAGDANRATVILDAARKRLTEGGSDSLVDRRQRLAADLVLLRDLDAIDQLRWTWSGEHFSDPTEVAKRTREALQRFGVDAVQVSLAEAAAKISASTIRERILLALDRLLRHSDAEGVRALLRQLDAAPFRDEFRDAVVAKDEAKQIELANQDEALMQPPRFTAVLGENTVISQPRRRQLLLAVVQQQPSDLSALMAIGCCCLGHLSTVQQFQETVDERIRWFQAAMAVSPDNYAALVNLGHALRGKGQTREAIDYFRKAIAENPNAEIAHNNLGLCLMDQGQFDQAAVCFEKAVQLSPSSPESHCNLGFAYDGKRQMEQAVVFYRKAIEFDANYVRAHHGLGLAYHKQSQMDAALGSYRRVIELDPSSANAHYGIGLVLQHKGRIDEAIAYLRRAIELDPKDAKPHYDLGNIHSQRDQLNEANACFRRAIDLDPEFPQAHCNLGVILGRQGRFAESLVALKRGHELGTKQADWTYPSGEWLAAAEAKALLEAKLVAALKGEYSPQENSERLQFAEICMLKRLPFNATRFYTAAFAADPTLVEDQGNLLRLRAAGSAVLAATGRGQDTSLLDAAAKSSLREQAVAWLKADLAAWNKRLESSPEQTRPMVVRILRRWQQTPELTGIRDRAEWATMSPEEAATLTRLWDEVAELLQRAQTAEQKP